MILRVPGIGVKSAKLIVVSRRYARLGATQLKRMGIVMKKAQYFITCHELPHFTVHEAKPENIRRLLTQNNRKKIDEKQLIIPFEEFRS